MRSIPLLLGLLLSPPAHAGLAQGPFTLIGSLVGGVGGALLGAPVYGAIDPYQSDDGLEWVIIGAPIGFGVGAAIGGTVAHTLTLGKHPARVLLLSGAVAVVGGTLLALTPMAYEHFADDRLAATYVSGLALSVVGVPIVATLTSTTSFKGEGYAPVALVPTLGRRGAGAALVGRF